MSLQNILSKKNRALLRELVATDFKLRYQGSVLGYLWSLLRPLFLFAIMYVVFGKFLKIGSNVPHYPIYLLLGVVLWGFFVEATSQGLSAIVGRGDLIRKVNFPKYIIVVSGTISALINLFLNLLIVVFFMVITHVGVSDTIVFFPLILVELYIVALAVAFFLSAAFVKYRDISYIWEVGLQAAFYAIPILYPLTMVLSVSKLAAQLLMLNPIAQLIQDARYSLITHKTTTLYDLISNRWVSAIPFVIAGLLVVLAVLYFRKNSRFFAEDV